jgi:hypothetical protein
VTYFFLYPFGHLGFFPITFKVDFPLIQLIVDDFLADGDGFGEIEDSLFVVDGVGEGLLPHAGIVIVFWPK